VHDIRKKSTIIINRLGFLEYRGMRPLFSRDCVSQSGRRGPSKGREAFFWGPTKVLMV
jgi:hypothetical protein